MSDEICDAAFAEYDFDNSGEIAYAEYIRYFAGIDAHLIPSYCGYVSSSGAKYSPDGTKPILIARNHNNPRHLYDELQRAAARATPGGSGGGVLRLAPLKFMRTEEAYPGGFEYTDLAKHPAVVVVS